MKIELKTCSKCGQTKPLDQFHKHKPSPDGRKPSCKACRLAYENGRYATDPEFREEAKRRSRERSNSPEGKMKAREYARRPEVRERIKQRRNTPEAKAKYKIWGKAWREKNPDYQKEWKRKNPHRISRYSAKARALNPNQRKAQTAVANAIARGELARASTQACIDCGAQAAHYHHHKGYERKNWLTVVPICVQCHANIHN